MKIQGTENLTQKRGNAEVLDLGSRRSRSFLGGYRTYPGKIGRQFLPAESKNHAFCSERNSRDRMSDLLLRNGQFSSFLSIGLSRWKETRKTGAQERTRTSTD